jgi:hypothetical protein
MEESLLRQIRILQGSVLVLSIVCAALIVNVFHSLVPVQKFNVIEVGKVNIRESDGVLKASLSNSAGFRVFGRANQEVTFSGLMFYNQEGEEAGGLVYDGKALPGGQHSSAALTFDQFRSDQNIYLAHDEDKSEKETVIADGLSVNARPDYTGNKEEYEIYGRLEKMPEAEREQARLEAQKAGKIMQGRVFVGVRRGVKDGAGYDNSGVFIKNKWGRNAIKIYVDADNTPHFEVFDPLGKDIVYQLKIPKS